MGGWFDWTVWQDGPALYAVWHTAIEKLLLVQNVVLCVDLFLIFIFFLSNLRSSSND